MKEKGNVKNVIRLCVFIVALIAVVATGVGTGLFSSVENLFAEFHFDLAAILRLAVMVFLVLAVTNLILFILGLFHPKKHRARTVITLLSSAVKYISAIIMICWGLAILGADIGTIVAGVGILALIIGFGAESLIWDVVTGVFMLFENLYNVGDFVEVDGFRGKVCNIGIRTTMHDCTIHITSIFKCILQ